MGNFQSEKKNHSSVNSKTPSHPGRAGQEGDKGMQAGGPRGKEAGGGKEQGHPGLQVGKGFIPTDAGGQEAAPCKTWLIPSKCLSQPGEKTQMVIMLETKLHWTIKKKKRKRKVT